MRGLGMPVCTTNKPTIKDTTTYLSYLKEQDRFIPSSEPIIIDPPEVNQESMDLALAIAKGIGGIQNFATIKIRRPLFEGSSYLYQNRLSDVLNFFHDNKENIIGFMDDIIETKYKGNENRLILSLSGAAQLNDDVIAAYKGIRDDDATVERKKIHIRCDMIANLLYQILYYTEQNYAQSRAAA